MLTRELAIARFENGLVLPDRLTRIKDQAYVEYAQQLCEVYRNGIGWTRKSLHQAVQRVLEQDPECPVRRIGAFCKLLDEWSQFDRGNPRKTAELRRAVFRRAASFHPLVEVAESILEHAEKATKGTIASELGTEWLQLKEDLFADLIENHRLKTFEEHGSPLELLARYNVAQTQVALLDSVRMVIDATAEWKTILRYAKLAGLMHRILKTETGYRFDLQGPASVLRRTHRYGVAMARFLPGLLSCRGWTMTAFMKRKAARFVRPEFDLRLELSDRSGLVSPVQPPEEFDSNVESQFASDWGDESRGGWRLVREGTILHVGQRAFFPDFLLERSDGESIPLEILGFWTPEYLRSKVETLRLFPQHPILLAIPKSTRVDLEGIAWSPNHRWIEYANKLEIGPVLALLEEMTKR